MTLTATIVKRPMAALMIILAIIVFGGMSVMNMEQESMPSMETPMMIVMTNYSGVDPENIDKFITQEIEGAVGTLSGIDSISSQSRTGSSQVMLQYEYGTNMDEAYTELKESIDRVASRMPEDAGTPTVMKMSSTAQASIRMSVHSETRGNLLQYVEDELSPEFQKLSTVADVSVQGGEYVSVELKEELMTQYGLNMTTVAQAVANADFSQPSGEVKFGSQTMSLTSSVSYRSVEELREMPISLGNGNMIRLKDVADVFEAVQDPTSASRYNGEETISISLTKKQSASAVSLSRQAMEVVDSVNSGGGGVTIEVMSDESETIQDAISSVAQSLILGVVISMIVLFVFFGNIRASLIVGSSMPVSLLMAFICMSWMGFTLNVITMGAMVLGVGMMVDNSIVVIDSCFKNSGERTFAESAVLGTKFVLLSIVASTVTTVVVFLPLASISGMVGELFKPLGYTVAFALLASLFSAITLVPLFFAQFKPVEKIDTPAARFLRLCEKGYGRLLRVILNKKKSVFAATLALVALALFLATSLDMELMSSTDEGSVNINVTLRSGASLEKTDEIILGLEQMVASHTDVDRYSSRVSAGSGSVSVTLKDGRAMSTADVVALWRRETANITDCDVSVSSSSMMTSGMSSDEVSINLRGNDLDSLRDISEDISDLFRADSRIISVTTSLESGAPQLDLQVDIEKATALGLTPSEVASGVNRALNGVSASTLTRDGNDYSVRVEYPKDRYVNLSDLENMILPLNSGRSVPLMEVASLRFTNAAQSIRKEEGMYNVSVTGTPAQNQRFAAQSDLTARVNALKLPEGVSLSASSMNRMMDDAFGSIYQSIAVAVLLVFMVMTIQFESIKHSLMVMVCVPFSLIGSMGLLVLTGATLNMTSMLGFLVLVGTVVNNGILFVDTTNQYRQDSDVKDALVKTGRHRLRPILMTTMTTVLSMIPMAVGLGTGSEMMQGMGIVVIGGLTASTVLTLLLLPTFYLIIDGDPEKRRRKKEKRKQKRDEKVRAVQEKNQTKTAHE